MCGGRAMSVFLPFSTGQMLLFPEVVSQFAPISVYIGDLTGLLMVEWFEPQREKTDQLKCAPNED